MKATEERFVAAGDLRLWTERFGDRADPAALLVMGTSASRIGWPDELVETLVGGDRQVIRFDHRDTGRSTCVDFQIHPYTLADMAADTIAVLDGYGIAAAHIVGASLGGVFDRPWHRGPPSPARPRCGRRRADPRRTAAGDSGHGARILLPGDYRIASPN